MNAAICLGVPTVATEFGGIPYQLEGGKFGATVPTAGKSGAELVNSLAREVRRYLQAGRLSTSEKEAWHQHCAKKYDIALFEDEIRGGVARLLSTIDRQRKAESFKNTILSSL